MSPAHRSRTAWPDEREPEPPKAELPVYSLPPWVRKSLIAMGVCMVLMAIALGSLLYFVFGRSQYRDARDEAVQEQFRTGMCDILDSLPEGPFLQPVRDKYGCTDGIPIEQLTPEQQGRLQQFASGIDVPAEGPAPAPVTKPRRPPQDEPQAPARTTSAPPVQAAPTPGLPPATEPEPASPAPDTPGPLVDLNPITQPLCDALSICF